MVDVASFRVHALAEPEEIVIPDNTGELHLQIRRNLFWFPLHLIHALH